MTGNGDAVVIGASIAGLLAARALRGTYRRVTVLERDDLPDGAAPRRGVPQGRHLHALLAGGARVLDELLPGFTAELIAAGAATGDPQVDDTYYLDGHRLAPAPSGLTAIGATRPLLDHLIRRRVAALSDVDIRTGVAALAPLTSGGAVTGVRTDAGDLPAALVVDAAGAGSRALRWLTDLGFAEPRTERLQADVVYVTRQYRSTPEQFDGRHGALVVPFPGMPRGAAVMRQEGNRWGITLFGLVGEDPPTDTEGMLMFAKSLPVPDVADLLAEVEPLGDAVKMRYPASVRRRFEKQSRHPEGFLVTGDALCGFNPTYGQGMSVAAMEAKLLRELVPAGTAGLPARFYRGAAKIIDGAWMLAAGGDLRFPEVEGARGTADRVLSRYLDRYRIAASVDPVLGRTFIEVAHMLAPATAMVAPGHVVRVLRGARRARSRRPVG
ncbi:FAD-dependent oxidoreductase [Virgisporangium aliadipatigenens]|nr:squalene monooxygenase [Virgisporangium aliadipatigenens]